MELTLPEASFRHAAGLDSLLRALGSGASRYVGGIVRDTLLGVTAADVDLATIHPPEEVVARLRDAKIRSVPTGIAHGTVTAILPSGPVEITTLRHDLATDGRHAVVAFTDDWRDDAARRDFTINALYADPATSEIFDYFGGLDDLVARRVRFIGDPYRRIAEDHLRILRFFRFHARFGDVIDEAGLAACVERANDLMALSRERIASELLKLLVAPGAVEVVETMIDRGILRAVLPEIGSAKDLRWLVEHETANVVAPDPIRRLAALVPPLAAEAIGARLKLSIADRRRLIAATAGSGDEGPRALAYRVGTASAIDRLLLAGAHIDLVRNWTPPTFPIGGGALVARGLRKGPEVAATLRQIETAWIAEGFPNDVRVDQLADEIVAAALLASSIASASADSSGRA